MKALILCILSFLIVTRPGSAAVFGGTQTQARPTSIQIILPPIVTDRASYAFEIVLTEFKPKNGPPQIRAVATITKTGDGTTIRLREIIQVVQTDSTQFTVTADGHDFVLEAGYTEAPSAEGVPPREIPTTLGQMFSGSPIGLKVRRL